MAWSYSGDPGASDLDAVRFLLGDTVEASATFSDEELLWLLTQRTNVWFAAALAAETAAAEATKAASQLQGGVKTKTVGALSITFSDAAEAEQAAKTYRVLAKSLRFNGAMGTPIVVYSGGISKIDKEATEADTDWDRGSFSRGMHDYPGTDVETQLLLE